MDYKARPLLENNSYIKKILVYKPSTASELMKESFDSIINFEKKPNVVSLVDSIKSKHYYGFTSKCADLSKRLDIEGDKSLVEISQDINKKRSNDRCWQDILANSIDKKWNKEPYVLGYKPKSQVVYDLGFNWTTSSAWTNKSWPKKHWKELDLLLRDSYHISWQEGMDNLYDYIEWINSCKLIVTSDTLGLHLALALNKRVVALFGPTPYQEIYFYGLGSYVMPDLNYKCIPCVNLNCDKEKMCMEYIDPRKVSEKIKYEFEKIKPS